VLAKNSGSDYDTKWSDGGTGGVGTLQTVTDNGSTTTNPMTVVSNEWSLTYGPDGVSGFRGDSLGGLAMGANNSVIGFISFLANNDGSDSDAAMIIPDGITCQKIGGPKFDLIIGSGGSVSSDADTLASWKTYLGIGDISTALDAINGEVV
jgi:hypothetical protein